VLIFEIIFKSILIIAKMPVQRPSVEKHERLRKKKKKSLHEKSSVDLPVNGDRQHLC